MPRGWGGGGGQKKKIVDMERRVEERILGAREEGGKEGEGGWQVQSAAGIVGLGPWFV